MNNLDDTIAAVATPPGEGGIAAIRISGTAAVQVADSVFSGDVKKFKTHTAHYGHIIDQSGCHVDDVLLLPMLSPKSYTGEDTVEIFCHGGSLITRRVLEVILKAGARAAGPGEFTYRSYLHGQIDLAQAEAVQELIHAKNEYALDAAEKQLEGSLSTKIKLLQNRLSDLAAVIEAWVDYPEEGLEFMSMEQLSSELSIVEEEIKKLLASYHDGKILHDGLSLCLIGAPNVGKSSLMNALLDKERAIVSNIPGTTRDILEDHLRLNGLNFRLTDTAGIHETEEVIEMEGIRRSKKAMDEADLILLVLDATEGLRDSDQILLKTAPEEKTVIIWNKTDLPHEPAPLSAIAISAKNRLGLENLHQEIDRVIWKKGPPSRDEILITNVRHKEALQDALLSLQTVIKGLQDDISAEFVSHDMRSSLGALGRVIGTDVAEDILSSIFSNFCVGK